MSLKRFLRGTASVLALFSALCIGGNTIGSTSDYKAMIDNFWGVSNSITGSADTYAFMSEYENTTELLTERVKVAEQISEEGSVLLKNNGALPLRQNGDTSAKKVTVIGSRAYTYKSDGVTLRDERLTSYAGIVGSVIHEEMATTEEGTYKVPITLKRALEKENISINPVAQKAYDNKNFPNMVSGSEANGSSASPYAANEPSISIGECGDYQSYSDAVIVVIGRASGEGREYLPGPAGIGAKDGSTCSIGLSDNERRLIDLAAQMSDNVIVLINSAVAMELDELKNNDKVSALMWIGLPGAYGMNGVARLISGSATPSGHLSDTYAVNASFSPAAQNFGVSTQTNDGSFTWSTPGHTDADDGHYVVLAEGIYTGYTYYETRYADCVAGDAGAKSSVGASAGKTAWNYEDEMAYTFGYGLSYTTFTQEIVEDSFKYDQADKSVTVDVKVTNTGDYAGKDVAQLYVQTPYTAYDKAHGVEKSAIQLVGFEKTELLQPGEEATLTVKAEIKYIASYDKTASHNGVTGGYILDAGNYYFAIGNGAHEALNNVLYNQNNTNPIYQEEGASVNEKGVYVWDITKEAGFSFNADGVDAEYLGVSESGYTIQNQLEDADYNYYVKNTVTYLTRQDWAGTFPKPYTGLAVTAEMEDPLNSKVYKWTTGTSDVKFGVDHEEEEDEEGNPMKNKSIAEYKLFAYEDERWDYLISEITFDEAWALSPYGGTFCQAFASVNAPEVWQIDGPNGNNSRSYGNKAPKTGVMAVPANDPNKDYYSCDMPCEPVTAATFSRDLLFKQGQAYGEDNLWSRNGMMWAPGMNLHRTPFNSRNHEYYSEDAMLTNICGTEFVSGGLTKGAILAAKHFAFNTQESFREGLTQFMEEQSAREKELRGFQGTSEDAEYVNALGNTVRGLGYMTSFSRVGVYGVNGHTGLMKNILRGEWGFKGLISTDMVVGGNFFNPQDSVPNNVTFMATSNAENLLSSYWPDYNNKSKVKSDPVMMQALYENMHFYMYAIANSAALNGLSADTVIQTDVQSWWQVALVWSGGCFAVMSAAFVVLSSVLVNKKRKGGF